MSFEFVVEVPAKPSQGVLYISTTYATAIHLCACGCGQEVVTPLSPAGWRLTFDGETVSLYPSIGNWGLPCRSHYWLERNEVRWARRWSQGEINLARMEDRQAVERHVRRRRGWRLGDGGKSETSG